MRSILIALIALSTSGTSIFGQQQGPIGKYYLTDSDDKLNIVVQGPNVLQTAKQYCRVPTPICHGEDAIAVVGSTVRTLGAAHWYGTAGAEYGLNLVPVGPVYRSYPGQYFLDGTSDGTHIYSIDDGSNAVYSFDLNWSNPQALFGLPGGGFTWVGITYDPSNNSLWVSTNRSENNTLADYSLEGTLLTSFTVSGFGSSALAIDVDGTLWFRNGSRGTFLHYSRDGQMLGSVSYQELEAIGSIWGGEIHANSDNDPDGDLRQ